MKDVNDKILQKAGFFRDPICDNPNFNAVGNITYWKNKRGVRVITEKKKRMTLDELVNHVINHTSYLAREELKKRIMSGESQDLIK